jgi:hypothetical protein
MTTVPGHTFDWRELGPHDPGKLAEGRTVELLAPPDEVAVGDRLTVHRGAIVRSVRVVEVKPFTASRVWVVVREVSS